ncbi:MAG TPA: CHRD domain-containing protein [Chloroflexota bacterium]|nr:CHRD domain-containing protein [Chloroflexota bacterium]
MSGTPWAHSLVRRALHAALLAVLVFGFLRAVEIPGVGGLRVLAGVQASTAGAGDAADGSSAHLTLDPSGHEHHFGFSPASVLAQATPSLTPGGLGPGCTSTSTLFTATLTGTQEVPPTGSAATGTATFQLNPGGNSLSVTVFTTGLTLQTVTLSHIHGDLANPGPPGVSAPVTADIFNPANPAAQGPFTNPFTNPNVMANQSGNFPSILAAMRAGLTYINIHTQRFPGGEIRGQISCLPATPTPTATPPPTATVTPPPTATATATATTPATPTTPATTIPTATAMPAAVLLPNLGVVPPPPLPFLPPPPPPLLPPPPPAPTGPVAPARGAFPEVPVIPEAGSLGLLSSGLAALAGLLVLRRRRG